MHGQSTVKRVLTFGVAVLIGTWIFAGIASASPADEVGGVRAARVVAGEEQGAAQGCEGTPNNNASTGNGAGCSGASDTQTASSEVSLAPAVSASRCNEAPSVAAESNDAPGRATEVLGTQVRRDAPALARTGRSTVPLLVLGTALCLLGFGLLRVSGEPAYR